MPSSTNSKKDFRSSNKKKNEKVLFKFTLTDRGKLNFDCYGILSSLIYPFIMGIGFIMSVITFPIFFIVWMCKWGEQIYNEKFNIKNAKQK